MRFTVKNFYFIFFLFCVSFVFCQKNFSTMGFLENKGQIVDQYGKHNKAIKYLFNTNGLNVQIRENGFSYDVYEIKSKTPYTSTANFKFTDLQKSSEEERKENSATYRFHRVDIDFDKCNKNVQILAELRSSDYENYYNLLSNADGVTKVYGYQKITYVNIYNNIDCVFFIPEDTKKPIEYNFVLKPGSNLTDIRLQIKGAKSKLVENKISMNLLFGTLEEILPLSWIEIGETKKEIAVYYKKLGKNCYGFESLYNVKNKTLIIDPTPNRLWGTYYGGNYPGNKSNTVKTDFNNNSVFTGSAYSSNNVGTSGAFQSTGLTIWATAFIAKMDSTGNRIWGTYLKNGNYEAVIKDIIASSTNEIYIGGYTWDQTGLGNSITTPGSFRPNGGAFSREGILMKFDENGQRIWGTFYGGENFDEIRTLDLDSSENIIIGGQTNSSNGIATNDAYLLNNPNSSFYGLGFFAKFDPNGIRLYGSYFLGTITYCELDSNDNLYLAGQYFEGDEYTNITTTNAHQTICNYADIFIVKFDNLFNKQWCTYYGGTEFTSSFGNSDRIVGLGTDTTGNLYLIGTTSSANNIATPNSFKESQTPGCINAFIAKFNSDGSRLWGTYFGSNNLTFGETAESGCVAPNGSIYLAGNTRNSAQLISTPNSFQPTIDGSDECFFAKFDTNGGLTWCSYYGTPSQDYSNSIFYNNNNVYLLGFSTAIATNGNDLGTSGTHMPNGGGIFLGKFQDCITSPQAYANNICLGENLQLNATGGTGYSWTGPNGFISSDQNPIILNASANNSGQYICQITGTGNCDGAQIVTVVVGDTTAPVPNIANLPTITGDCNTVITTIPTATDLCAGIIFATTTSSLNYSLAGNYTIQWIYDDGSGNLTNQNQLVIISQTPIATANNSQTFCQQDSAIISDIVIIGQNIIWYDAAINGIILQNSLLLQNGSTYHASQTINGCESARIAITINIQNTVAPTAINQQTFCDAQNANLSNIAITGNNITWYNSISATAPLLITTLVTDGVTYYATQIVNGCESSVRSAVTISITTTLNAIPFSVNLCDDSNAGFLNLDLNNFNSNFIGTTSGYTFTYYNSLIGAENQLQNEIINSNYTQNVGTNIVYVRIDSNTGCSQIVALQITLFPKPKIIIEDVLPLCERNSIIVHAGIGFDSYLWSTGETSEFININQVGNFSVTVSKINGNTTCFATKNFVVFASNFATITNIEIQDWTENENTISIFLSNNSIGDYEYSLDNINFQSSPIFTNLAVGIYTVYVKDKNTCGTIKETVFIISYPKFFTPNGDGVNDTWQIYFSQFEKNLKTAIYDRSGKLVKVITNNVGWDGLYNGNMMPADDYWFVVTRQNGEEHKGHFSLKR